MSKGQPKTLGQRLGLLTGFALIFGGVLGWAYALFQAPGHDAAPPVAIPQPPEPSTPVAVPVAGPTLESPDTELATELELEPEPDGETEPGMSEAEAEVEPSDVAVAEDPPAPRTSAGPPPAKAVPVRSAPVAVPDAVKAIRAAAAAARQRLETQTPASIETPPIVED